MPRKRSRTVGTQHSSYSKKPSGFMTNMITSLLARELGKMAISKGKTYYKKFTGYKKPPVKRGTSGQATGRVSTHKAKPVHTKYRQQGAVFKYENGLETTDPDAVYVGGGMAKNLVAETICFAIIRRLFQKMGQDITSFEDSIYNSSGNMQLSYNWYTGSQDTSLSQINLNILTNQTYKSLAQTLLTSIQNNMGDTPHQLHDIWLNTTTGSQQAHAIIRCSDTYVDFGHITKVAIQNRTKAGTTTLDENDEEITAVDNNPLRCRVYEGYSNGAEPSYRQEGEANYEGFVANPDTGIINAKASNTAVNTLKKLPYPSFFRKTTSTRKFVLQPGEIKYVQVSYQKTISLNKLFEEHFIMFTSSHSQLVGLGKFIFVGCSKMLDTRTLENPVLVGCEVNHLIRAKLHSRRTTAPPIIEVA